MRSACSSVKRGLASRAFLVHLSRLLTWFALANAAEVISFQSSLSSRAVTPAEPHSERVRGLPGVRADVTALPECAAASR